jgi:hypothetical protein
VQVEYSADIQGQDGVIATFRKELSESLRTTLGVNAEVVPLQWNTLERSEHKSNRIIDRRELFREFTAAP